MAPTENAAITAVTLGVADVAASLRFYVDGLGFREISTIPGEIAFVQSGHGPLLALWNVASMPGEYGNVGHGPLAPPMSLGQNVDSAAAVRDLYDRALAAGATAVTEPTLREWGGTSGCVADPDGFRWDFVHNPGYVRDADGSIRSV
ncbi:VOC family protein [Specibacter cremeus]|uniref:VOC family protein n=1 Tax=Specibacter cremeus TaxID=1629051 RepID=UPI000F79EDE4|nr:VOC family protein [Specibacter cremeus]